MNSAPQILYEDNHLLALNKPPGLLTQPSGTDRENLEDWAKVYLKESRQKPGAVFLEAVHRIDRDVSGVLLFASTSKALSRLNEQMRQRKTRKIYWALVEGSPPATGTLTDWLIHDDHRARITDSRESGAKKAELSYRSLERSNNHTLIEIELKTGRYHQIRIQFSSRGFPILGDRKYGSQARWTQTGICLHSRFLFLEHPVQKCPLEFSAPVPTGWPPCVV